MVIFETNMHIYLLFFRFVLQHGGRVLLADEMGLGKTLQAFYSHLNHE